MENSRLVEDFSAVFMGKHEVYIDRLSFNHTRRVRVENESNDKIPNSRVTRDSSSASSFFFGGGEGGVTN